MASTKKDGPVSARERVRAAKAKLDADRKERDKRIEEQGVTWYQLVDKIDAAQAAIEQARSEQLDVVVALDGEGVSVEDTAALLDLAAAEVRSLRKDARRVASDQPTAPVVAPADGGVDDETERRAS